MYHESMAGPWQVPGGLSLVQDDLSQSTFTTGHVEIPYLSYAKLAHSNQTRLHHEGNPAIVISVLPIKTPPGVRYACYVMSQEGIGWTILGRIRKLP
jgi:hypothetical protein